MIYVLSKCKIIGKERWIVLAIRNCDKKRHFIFSQQVRSIVHDFSAKCMLRVRNDGSYLHKKMELLFSYGKYDLSLLTCKLTAGIT